MDELKLDEQLAAYENELKHVEQAFAKAVIGWRHGG